MPGSPVINMLSQPLTADLDTDGTFAAQKPWVIHVNLREAEKKTKCVISAWYFLHTIPQ